MMMSLCHVTIGVADLCKSISGAIMFISIGYFEIPITLYAAVLLLISTFSSLKSVRLCT